jgi:nucleotide-binding universal stress UspA family protein
MDGEHRASNQQHTTDRMLLALEPGPQAVDVIKTGVRLADKLKAEVVVLGIRERAVTRGLAWDVHPAGELAEVVSQAIYELQRCGLSARGVIGRAVAGRVAEEIVYAAIQYRVDEVVMGSSRRTWLGKLISSSVCPRVLKLSPVPVVAVPPAAKAQATVPRRSPHFQSAA